MCKICGAMKPQGYITCGDSYCQETTYWESVVKTHREGSEARQFAVEKYEHYLRLAGYKMTGQI